MLNAFLLTYKSPFSRHHDDCVFESAYHLDYNNRWDSRERAYSQHFVC